MLGGGELAYTRILEEQKPNFHYMNHQVIGSAGGQNHANFSLGGGDNFAPGMSTTWHIRFLASC